MRDGMKTAAKCAGNDSWHAIAAAEALRTLEVMPQAGLDASAVAARVAAYGNNALPAARRRGPVLRLLAQFHNLLIYLLLVTAAITFVLGDRVDAIVILAVVLINALIGFLQEGKAERSLDAISSLLPFTSIVLRQGRRVELPAQQLVPGDIVYLASGDKVPADLRLLETHSLRIDESALTGESVAADKGTGPVPQEAALGDRPCMAYSGTLVQHGTGAGVVVAIGPASQIGRIGAMLDDDAALSTPLLRQIAHFGRWLTGAIVLLAGAMFAFGTLVRGYPALDMFAAAVGLAVAAVPEGLPAVITITLAIGVQRMARRRAIVRRLPAVEALGAVTVICTDKTGTLTRNEMAVRRVMAPDGVCEVGADGYAPSGKFCADGVEFAPAERAYLHDIARVCLLCNDAQLHQAGEQWELSGDPTEGALLSLALKAGLDAPAERAAHTRSDAIPFESEHGFMATLHADPGGGQILLLKGAPERVLPMCSSARRKGKDEALAAHAWDAPLAQAAGQGMRLIAVAMRRAPQAPGRLDMGQVQAGGFTLLGVLAMFDPPRAEAVEAVARCRAAGIRVKMITGDHAGTATAIGEQLGFPAPVRSITGEQMEGMDEAQLDAVLRDTDIFARAAPQHKLRLVRALQRIGEVVVMTGDGVNDAPALKCADIGVAMGRKGTEAAKQAAEMVLADDNFATLGAAVEEGRVVYDNIRKSIVFTLPTNGGEAGMVMLAILLGMTMPITSVQILWVNMITEVTLSLALAFEKPESDVMARAPRAAHEPLVTRFLLWRIVLVSLLMVAGCMGLFLWELRHGASLAVARTVVVNALVIGHVAYLFNTRRLTANALSWEGISGNRMVLLAIAASMACQACLTYLPVAQAWFGTAALSWEAWARIFGFGMALFLVVEFEKSLHRRLGKAPSGRA